MNEEDYKSVIASYQQKAFELFNQNIVLETQISSLRKTIETLTIENEKLKKAKKPTKQDAGDFV
jgi:prefoldin subunit 5